MATNFVLKFDGGGIKGESPIDGYSDYMQLVSLKFGGKQTGTFGTGGGGTGAGLAARRGTCRARGIGKMRTGLWELRTR